MSDRVRGIATTLIIGLLRAPSIAGQQLPPVSPEACDVDTR